MNHQTQHSGFTLIELAVVITIIALISGMGLVATSGIVESAKLSNTQKKMDEIENALMSFRIANNRLPCPSNAALGVRATGFGIEPTAGYTPPSSTATTTYNCIDLTAGTGTTTANYYWGAATNSIPAAIVEGAVPVRALGLPDDYAFDGWGGKFMYAVDAYATIPGAFNRMPPESSCSIIVQSGDGNARTGTSGDAVYALLSYGPTKHGAFTARETTSNTRFRYTLNVTQHADTTRNCRCNNSAANVSPPVYTD